MIRKYRVFVLVCFLQFAKLQLPRIFHSRIRFANLGPPAIELLEFDLDQTGSWKRTELRTQVTIEHFLFIVRSGTFCKRLGYITNRYDCALCNQGNGDVENVHRFADCADFFFRRWAWFQHFHLL